MRTTPPSAILAVNLRIQFFIVRRIRHLSRWFVRYNLHSFLPLLPLQFPVFFRTFHVFPFVRSFRIRSKLNKLNSERLHTIHTNFKPHNSRWALYTMYAKYLYPFHRFSIGRCSISATRSHHRRPCLRHRRRRCRFFEPDPASGWPQHHLKSSARKAYLF